MKDAESEEPGRHPNEEKGLPEDRQLSGKKLNNLKEEFDAMLAQMQAPGSREAMMGASMLRHRRYGTSRSGIRDEREIERSRNHHAKRYD